LFQGSEDLLYSVGASYVVENVGVRTAMPA
jgi:hypothetical protein